MCLFFFKQKTAYELRISDWSSDVCSSDLQTQRLGGLERLAVDVDDHLGDPVMVAQVDEQQVTEIALAVHPTAQPDGLARIGFTQFPAGVRAIGEIGRATWWKVCLCMCSSWWVTDNSKKK